VEKTKGKIEAEITEAVIRFEKEFRFIRLKGTWG
jgi:uncharacterized protein YbcI